MRNPLIQDVPEGTPVEEGYSRVWEHYSDELRLLDLKLRQMFVRRRMSAPDPQADAFRGMYVSEDEFMRMVGDWNEEEEEDSDDGELAFTAAEIRRLQDEIAARKAASAERNVFLPIVYISSVFALSEVEQQVVLLCLAVELDRKYERMFGFLADDLTVRLPNVGLALQLVCRSADDRRAARLSFASEGKLARYMLAKEDGVPFGRTLLSKPLSLDRRMATFLLDTGSLDQSLRSMVSIHYPDGPLEKLLVHKEVQEQLASFVSMMVKSRREDEAAVGVHLYGLSGSGKKLHLRHLCAKWGKSLLFADLRAIAADSDRFGETLSQVLREALLHQTVLAFTHTELLYPEEPDKGAAERLRTFQDMLDEFRLPLFLLSETKVRLEWHSRKTIWLEKELPVPDERERISLWGVLGEAAGLSAGGGWSGVAAKFRFTPGQIRGAIDDAAVLAVWESKEIRDVLEQACYRQIRHRLERKAVRIEPRYTWDDIVLPGEQKDLLRNACNQIKYRALVYGEWGFERKLAYGKGLSMLYAGPPGTGKTMSAQVVAKELRMELYKIDLSQVISKYIGETEKNLHEIFREAQKSGAILFFDETDALFGKRSEVKDAHDKYANIETAYLLQKMEEYEGISVLATNLLNNIDEAFLRRINYVIKFPFPDAEYREKIWKTTFPKEMPLSDDLDFKWLAQKYEIAGGNIKNVVLSAAFLAAEKEEKINMRHIVHAVRHELQKSGKIISRNDLEDY